MPPDEDDSDKLIAGLQAGDPAAELEFWRRYGERLERVADHRLSPRLQARVGPDDVALSACRTFLRRARLGEFRLPDSAALWRLLCVITLTKAREQVRYHQRQKRNVGQEIRLDRPSSDSGTIDVPDPHTDRPEAEDIADRLGELLESLTTEERAIVELKLQDLTNDEVAQRLNSSERTVRRMLKRVSARFEDAGNGEAAG